MLIPEYTSNNTAPVLSLISNQEEFDKLRQATTDKLLLVLFVAEWDESSKLLQQMIKEMPTNFT